MSGRSDSPTEASAIERIDTKASTGLTLLLASSIMALVGISLAASAWDRYASVLYRNDIFGFAALVAAAPIAVLLVLFVKRELTGLSRMRRLAKLRASVKRLRSQNAHGDEVRRRKAERQVLREITKLYSPPGGANRDLLKPLTAPSDKSVAKTADKDKAVEIVEETASPVWLKDLDEKAKQVIETAMLSAGTATAISPWGLLDPILVGYFNLKMIFGIAQVYGARPGYLSTLKILLGFAGSVGTATGLGQLQKFASKFSVIVGGIFRLAKALANAVFTGKLGVYAIEQCRPIPLEQNEKIHIAKLMRKRLKAIAGNLGLNLKDKIANAGGAFSEAVKKGGEAVAKASTAAFNAVGNLRPGE